MAKTILLADDEADMVTLLAARLNANGYQVVPAHDGEAALRLAQERRPDLVILDAMMPKQNGYETCRKLKADSRCKGIPVMMLTARTHPDDVKQATECGADDYMTKPLDPKEFLRRIEQLTAPK